MPPAARVGDMHTCPMQTPGTPPIPHVGGPILPPGAVTVLIGGQPAARVGDMCTCVGPPDTIAKGSPTVKINYMMAARIGDTTAHGGSIVLGFPTVIIGEAGGGSSGPGGGGGGGGANSVAAGVAASGLDDTPINENASKYAQQGSGAAVPAPPTAAPAPAAASAAVASTPATQTMQQKKDNLCLGVNQKYADAVKAAADRTGADPAVLAGFINAEAAKAKDGTWIAESAAGSTSATGLMQFTAGTWKTMALAKGTYLNQVATEKGLVQEVTHVIKHKVHKLVTEEVRKTTQIADGKTEELEELRNDPETSVTAGAEYMNQNLAALDKAGLVPADATEADKAVLGYLAHHEGLAGAKKMLNGTLTDDDVADKIEGNMSAKAQEKYLNAYDSKAAAYTAWLKDYAKQKADPDQFRCDKIAEAKKAADAKKAAEDAAHKAAHAAKHHK